MNTDKPTPKPVCKVNGLIAPRAMCAEVIVGGKYCGFSGDCPHKSVSEIVIERVKGGAA